MRPSAELRKIVGVLERVVAKTTTGTNAEPRITTRVDLARDRAEERAGGCLPRDGIRGGSRTPDEVDERKERELVCRQAELDYFDIATLVRQLAADANELERIVNRQAETVHESKLPMDVLPGCRSCARRETEHGSNGTGVTITGGYSDIDDRYITQGLCRACGQFKSATGGLPPLRWCYLLDRDGGRAANRWLGDHFPDLLKSVQAKQTSTAHKVEELERSATTFTDMTAYADYQCIRPQGHDGEHRGVRDGQSFAFPMVSA